MRRISLLALGLVIVFSGAICAAENNYWEKFKEGSWVLHEYTGGVQMKQTLVGKAADEVTLRSETIMNGNTISSVDVKVPLKTGMTGIEKADVKISDATFEVKGKTLSCKVFETNTPMGLSKSWISADVPGGLLKSQVNDTDSIKIVDYEVK